MKKVCSARSVPIIASCLLYILLIGNSLSTTINIDFFKVTARILSSEFRIIIAQVSHEKEFKKKTFSVANVSDFITFGLYIMCCIYGLLFLSSSRP